jgi:ankyrin repeat protein
MTEMTEFRKKLQQALQLERTFTVQVEAYLSNKHLRPTEEGTFSELLQKYKHYLLRRELLVVQGSLEECKDPSHEVEIERMRGKLFAMAHGTTTKKTKKKRLKQINKVKVNCGKCEHPQLFYTDTDGPYELVVDSGTGKQVRKYKELEILQWVSKGDLPKVTEPFMMMSMERDMTEAPEALRRMEKLYKESYALFRAASKDLLSKSADCKAWCEAVLSYLMKEDNLYRSIKVCAEEAVTAINEQYGEAPNGRRNPEKDRLMGRCLWLGIRRRMVHEAAKKLQALHERYREKKKAGRAHKAPTAFGGLTRSSKATTVSPNSVRDDGWQLSKTVASVASAAFSPIRATTEKRGRYVLPDSDSSDSEEEDDEVPVFWLSDRKKKKQQEKGKQNRDARARPYKNLSEIERQFFSVVWKNYLNFVNCFESMNLQRHAITKCCMDFAQTLLPMLNYGSSAVRYIPIKYAHNGVMVCCELTGVYEKRANSVGMSLSTCGPVRKICDLEEDHPRSDGILSRCYGDEGEPPPSSFFSFSSEHLMFVGATRSSDTEMSFAEMYYIGYVHYTHPDQIEGKKNRVPAMMRSNYEGMEMSNKRIMFGWSHNHFYDRFSGVCYPYEAVEYTQKTGSPPEPLSLLWNKSSPVLGDCIMTLTDEYSLHYQGMFDVEGMADGFGELRRLGDEPTEVLCACNYHGIFSHGVPHGVGLWIGEESGLGSPTFYLGVWEAGVLVHGLYLDGTDPWIKCTDESGVPTERWYWNLRLRVIGMWDERRKKTEEKLVKLCVQCSMIPFKGVAKEEHDRQMQQLHALCRLYREKNEVVILIVKEMLTSCYNLLKRQEFEQNVDDAARLNNLLVWDDSKHFRLDIISWLSLLNHTDPIRERDMLLLKILFEKQSPDTSRTRGGWTPMHSAAYGGHANVLKVLVDEYKVDVMVYADDGATPMHLAACQGHAKVVTLLAKEYKADVMVRCNTGGTPLHSAAREGRINVVTLLIDEHKADVMARDNSGNTPMHNAAGRGHTNVVALLAKEYKADVMARDNKGVWTPMHSAAQGGHEEVVALLADEYKAEIIFRSNKGVTPMHCAAKGGHANVVRLLADKYEIDVMVRDRAGFVPMHSAAHFGHENVLTLLAKEYKVDVMVRNIDGITPMHCAARQGHLSMVTLLADEYKADVMARDNIGKTPMHLAAARGHQEMVLLLAEQYKADFMAQDNNGRTPLSYVAELGQEELMVLCCSAGLKKLSGRSPLKVEGKAPRKQLASKAARKTKSVRKCIVSEKWFKHLK